MFLFHVHCKEIDDVRVSKKVLNSLISLIFHSTDTKYGNLQKVLLANTLATEFSNFNKK